MQLKIQRADKRHLAAINKLIVETRIGSPMKKIEGQFWFVRVDNKIVGCMGAELIGNNSAILTHLAVNESYRKRGIGMTLFKYVIDQVRRQNATTLALITMYYLFKRFKKRGFKLTKRALLPERVKNHWMFTAKRYMKCAAMIQEFPPQ